MVPSCYLLLLALALAALCTSVILQPNRRGPFRGRAEVGLVGSLVLAVVSGYYIYLESRATAHVSDYVTPYPKLRVTSVVPFELEDGPERTWMFESEDDPRDIVAFYDDPRHTSGWRVTSDRHPVSPTIELERDDLRLQISVARYGGSTKVIYMLDGN